MQPFVVIVMTLAVLSVLVSVLIFTSRRHAAANRTATSVPEWADFFSP